MTNSVKGYAGQILRIDLSSHTYNTDKISELELKQYLGGAGLAAAILYKETSADTNPLGPDNLLIFMTGPFTGTDIPCTSKHAVVSKSPLTGIYGEADSGGTWGVNLKRAGYDGIVIKGASSRPVYLYIYDNNVEIRSAEHLWGMDTYEIDGLLKRETSQKAVVSAIGPAGEKLVKISSIMNDGLDARAAGRCGLGAVMGSKKLKAIVVEGSNKVEVEDLKKLRNSIRGSAKHIADLTKGLRDFGTGAGMLGLEQIGALPIKNWKVGLWPEVEKITGVAMAEKMLVKNYGCGNCIIKCGRVIKSEKYSIPESAGPEYETLAAFGSLCLIDNLDAIAKANELCNRFGLDTISTGNVIAFALEAKEKGILSEEDLNGLDLNWGNEDSVLTLITQIGTKSGLGAILGLGVKAASSYIGGDTEKFSLHVKGLELPFHDPRAHNSLAVAYATSNRGACHLQAFVHPFEKTLTMPELGYNKVHDRFAVEGKGILTAKMQNLCAVFDSLKLCKFLIFGGINISKTTEWLYYVTGWKFSKEDFMSTGERIYNLKRLYNVKMGISRKDDNLPYRILKEPRGEGGAADNLPPLNVMLDEYYSYRGWDNNGIPLPETINRLNIERL